MTETNDWATPQEREFAQVMDSMGIKYSRPETAGGRVDFYLPELQLSVEVKQHPTPRLHDQLESCGRNASIMVLCGKDSVQAFASLFTRLRQREQEREGEIERLRGAVAWALGEEGEWPARQEGEGAFYWRKALRALAAEAKPEAPEVATECACPAEGEIVFVQGGVAQYRKGLYYTGMEDPRWERPILWTVTWWYPAYSDPGDKLRPDLAAANERAERTEGVGEAAKAYVAAYEKCNEENTIFAAIARDVKFDALRAALEKWRVG